MALEWPGDNVVTLNSEQRRHGATVGFERRLHHLDTGKGDKRFTPLDSWGNDIDSACAEKSFSVWSRIHWDGGEIGNYKERDVGGYQIRWSAKYENRLQLYPDTDNPLDVFVFVTGLCPTFAIRGWCYGWEGLNSRGEWRGETWYVNDAWQRSMLTLPPPRPPE